MGEEKSYYEKRKYGRERIQSTAQYEYQDNNDYDDDELSWASTWLGVVWNLARIMTAIAKQLPQDAHCREYILSHRAWKCVQIPELTTQHDILPSDRILHK
ncbi:hypothetical protein DMENIID0001_023110 [Sergentomyia squamirostris]